MKHFFSLIAVMVFAFLFLASSSSKNSTGTTAPTKKTFSYAYKTKEANKLGSANITLALINPYCAKNFEYYNVESFSIFAKYMGDDVKQLLIDKGYHFKGPYSAFDEMIFDDKKNSDVAIEISIMPEIRNPQGGWEAQSASFADAIINKNAPTLYAYRGSFSLAGRINIEGSEPLTHEKIWYKSVEIPVIENIDLSTYYKYETKDFRSVLGDPKVYNSIGEALQLQYDGIMKKIDAQLDPQEFVSLKTQIKELKAKKGY